jgi:hypothetical protein
VRRQKGRGRRRKESVASSICRAKKSASDPGSLLNVLLDRLRGRVVVDVGSLDGLRGRVVIDLRSKRNRQYRRPREERKACKRTYLGSLLNVLLDRLRSRVVVGLQRGRNGVHQHSVVI